jgi:hypothetical protein
MAAVQIIKLKVALPEFNISIHSSEIDVWGSM